MYSSVTSSLKSITGYQIQLEHFFPNSTLSSSSVWSATFSISLSSNLTVLCDSSSFCMVDLLKFPELDRHLMTSLGSTMI
jgi:hypothetical protein